MRRTDESGLELTRCKIDTPLQHGVEEATIALGVGVLFSAGVIADLDTSFIQEVEPLHRPSLCDLNRDACLLCSGFDPFYKRRPEARALAKAKQLAKDGNS